MVSDPLSAQGRSCSKCGYKGNARPCPDPDCPSRSAAKLPELRCVDPTRHETHEWEDGWTRYRCPGSPDARSAATRSRAGVLLTVLLAASGGFAIAGGVWHKGGATTIAVGCVCLLVASARALA